RKGYLLYNNRDGIYRHILKLHGTGKIAQALCTEESSDDEIVNILENGLHQSGHQYFGAKHKKGAERLFAKYSKWFPAADHPKQDGCHGTPDNCICNKCPNTESNISQGYTYCSCYCNSYNANNGRRLKVQLLLEVYQVNSAEGIYNKRQADYLCQRNQLWLVVKFSNKRCTKKYNQVNDYTGKNIEIIYG